MLMGDAEDKPPGNDYYLQPCDNGIRDSKKYASPADIKGPVEFQDSPSATGADANPADKRFVNHAVD